MAKWQVESGVAHGRGFSQQDPNGLCAKITSFMKRPAANGTPQTCTADAGTNNITCAGHGYVTGESVSFTSTTALPSPLAINTEYYVIYVDANTFQLATSYYLAGLGTAIDITDGGTGTHSVYALGGGAGWFIYDDLSSVNPFVINYSAVNSGAETITITSHGLHTGRPFSYSGTAIGGLTAGSYYYVIRVDENTIKVASSYSNAYNATAINITAAVSGTHTITPADPSIVFCDTLSPSENDYNTGPSGGPPKYLKIAMPTTLPGYVLLFFACGHDTVTHFTPGIWSGQRIPTLDDSDFIYNVRGGDEGFMLHDVISATWHSVCWDEWVGVANKVEGTDKVGTLQSSVTAGSNVVLQLGAGEAANFTAEKYYFIYDFSTTSASGHLKLSNVQYVKVSSVNTSTDQITIYVLAYNFSSGSVIGAYVHRWASFGDGNTPTIINISSAYSKIPYCSSYNSGAATYAFHDQRSYLTAAIRAGWFSGFFVSSPDDEQKYDVMRPVVAEYTIENYSAGSSTDMNRWYGPLKNTYIIYLTSMLAGQEGKVINGKNYIFFKLFSAIFNDGGSSYSVMVLDSEATT